MGIFTLEVQASKKEDEFSVFAEGAKEEAQEIAFAPDKEFSDKLVHLHERRPEFRYANFAAQESDCVSIGEKLFQSFFPKNALDRFHTYRNGLQLGEGPRVALHLPRDLYYLPWELLRDPDDPFGQFLSIQGSLVRYDGESKKPRDILADPAGLTFLFILAAPENKPILPQFDPVGSAQIKFRVATPPTFDEFARIVDKEGRNLTGFIFFGHGEVDPIDRVGILYFIRQQFAKLFRSSVGDPKPVHSISDVIGLRTKINLALVFACESAWAQKNVPFQQSVAGSILDRTWLSVVVGAQTPIEFFAAREFLEKMLVILEERKQLDLAISAARVAVRGMDPSNYGGPFSRLDWWVPVVYARVKNFNIFPEADPLPEIADTPIPTPIATADLELGQLAASVKAVIPKLSRLFSSDRDAVRDLLPH